MDKNEFLLLMNDNLKDLNSDKISIKIIKENIEKLKEEFAKSKSKFKKGEVVLFWHTYYEESGQSGYSGKFKHGLWVLAIVDGYKLEDNKEYIDKDRYKVRYLLSILNENLHPIDLDSDILFSGVPEYTIKKLSEIEQIK